MSRTIRDLTPSTRYGHMYFKRFKFWRNRASQAIATVDELKDYGYTPRTRYGLDLNHPTYWDDIHIGSETLKQRKRSSEVTQVTNCLVS